MVRSTSSASLSRSYKIKQVTSCPRRTNLEQGDVVGGPFGDIVAPMDNGIFCQFDLLPVKRHMEILGMSRFCGQKISTHSKMSVWLPITNSPRTMDIVFFVWFCTQCAAVTILDNCVARFRLDLLPVICHQCASAASQPVAYACIIDPLENSDPGILAILRES